MSVEGHVDGRFGPVRECFTQVIAGHDNAWGLGFGLSDDGYGMGGLGGNYGGTCPTGGYSIGFVTGTVGSFDRVEALENTLRACLGLPPLPPAR
jgi:hypothetical protein